MRAVVRIRREPHYRSDAFKSGLQRVGFTIREAMAKPDGPDDWLVLWNKKAGADEHMADAWEKAGGTVIVTENGYLSQVDKTHYAISVHGHNGSGWFPQLDDERFSALGFGIKTRPIAQGSRLVVRGQRGLGSKLMASPHNWGRITAAKLQHLVRMPVRLYEHPGDKGKFEKDAAALVDAAGLLIWSSAMGVRALAEGVPVCYAAPHWICGINGDVTRWSGSGVPCFYAASVEEHRVLLEHMAHGQWHHEEIATGEPFKRIFDNMSAAAWP